MQHIKGKSSRKVQMEFQELRSKYWGKHIWARKEKKPNTQIEKLFGKHPTQKPLELLKRIVLASTNEGDLILDPFCGSSTTGLACTLLNRKFIGIDTEKKYLDLSIKRFEQLEKDKLNKVQVSILKKKTKVASNGFKQELTNRA